MCEQLVFVSPDDNIWPFNGTPRSIHERGMYDDDRLVSMAEELLRIAQGLWTKQVSLGSQRGGWREHGVAALNAACIAGRTDGRIRALVANLEAAHTAAV